jgi:exonuclease SbcC
MKIKKLEIKNLASIQEATVDFEKAPLSDAELFLITGTTGAGKTTLLDAICLALYNTTPRIAKGQTGKSEANEDNLTGKDSRNIMRLNTGHAYSKLWFEGNDGHNYLAEWSVSRGKHCKVNVSMSNELWTITNLDTGAHISGQKDADYKEVAAKIIAAVGLDFKQFCRTTMLAQGEFTEFLKSDEDAKAEILEKISGTEIYRKI